jgi:hypothetical protein
MQLNQVAAGIGEDRDDDGPCLGRFAREHDAECRQPRVLLLDVGNLE